MVRWKSGLLVAVVLGLLAGVYLTHNLGQPAQAEAGPDKGIVGGPHYTVVMTEGHNLIVTDNKTNTLYFYTIDKDQPIGSDLKLRGSVNLNQVGKAVVHPVKTKAE